MDKRIDFDNGVVEETYYDPLTKELHVKRTTDIEPILKRNLALRNDESSTKLGMKKGMWYYGSIPNIVLAQWIKEGVDVNDTNELIRMLNKPENQRYKTTTKRHA